MHIHNHEVRNIQIKPPVIIEECLLLASETAYISLPKNDINSFGSELGQRLRKTLGERWMWELTMNNHRFYSCKW